MNPPPLPPVTPQKRKFGFFRGFLIPTLIVGAGTAIGFWVQQLAIDKYKADQIRQINLKLDEEELAEMRARQNPHEPKGFPKFDDNRK